MKNQFKTKAMLKIAMAGLFVFAMAFGASTTMSFSDSFINPNLLSFGTRTAQGEVYDYPGCEMEQNYEYEWGCWSERDVCYCE